MKKILPKSILKITGFGLILFIVFMYGDKLTYLQTRQEKNANNSGLSDLKQDATYSRLLDLKQDATYSRLLDLKQDATYSLQLHLKQDTPVPRPPDRKNVIISNIPDYFEINMGQANDSVRFLFRGKNYALFLTPGSAILRVTGSGKNTEQLYPDGKKQDPTSENIWLSFQLTGSNPEPEIQGVNKLRSRSNYLTGGDPDKWQKNVPHYEMVKYSNIYDGIDLVYHNRKNSLEYDFIVAPGADPGRIHFSITGAEWISEDESGNLLLHTRLGEVMIKTPQTYQEFNGKKEYIASDYEIDDGTNISIKLNPYDRSKTLIIDPELLFSSYLGGNGGDGAYGIDADDEGNVYVTGSTTSTDFPTIDEPQTLAGKSDVFISKLNPVTSELIFTTILGGSNDEKGLFIGIDGSKNINVAGWTNSDDFPVKNAIQQELGDTVAGNTDKGDVFTLKLDPEGSSLVYSTYLGGKERDLLFDAVFDGEGNIYLSGDTKFYLEESTCVNHFPQYPVKYQEDICYSAHFVLKINGDGSLQYSRLFESTSIVANCLAVNNSGNACLLRWAHMWHAGFEPSWNLISIVKLNGTGSEIVDSLSFLLSNAYGWASTNDFQLDDMENIYIAGMSDSSVVPVTPNAYQSINHSYQDGFFIKLNGDASEYLYATYLGGIKQDYAKRIKVDNKGCIWIYGNSGSPDFPTQNAYQATFGGYSDAFLARIDPSKEGAASLLYSSYLGGESTEIATDIAIDANENVYLTGYTWSTGFPVENALISSYSGTAAYAFISVFAPTDTIDLIYDEVAISGGPVFRPLRPPNTQQVLPQYLIRDKLDTAFFRFAGRSTDGRVGLRVTNTLVRFGPPLILEMSVFDPDKAEIATWTIQNIGEGNRGVQFDVTKNGYYTVKVWAKPESESFPAPFQIHLAGNVGWPQPLLYPIPDIPGTPDDIRATRQDILINSPVPRPQLLRGNLGDVRYDPEAEVSQTSLFKFANIFQVSEHAVAVLTPFNKTGFEKGRAPVRMPDPNPMPDITTPTAPFNNTVPFPGGGYSVDFTQVPIPAAVDVPVQLRQAASLGKADGISVGLPVQIPAGNQLLSTPAIILDMGSGQEIVDGTGNDFRVISPEGNYRVAVSNTVFEDTFIPIGEIFTGDQEFDLNGTYLNSARYIRIIAEPTASIDAVRALNYFCDEIRTDIGPVSKVSYVTLTARRSKAPQTMLDPLMELIGPDGALNATNESGFGDDLSVNSSDAALINMELNQEGFYRYLGRGHDKTPNEESFGVFYTRYESAGSYDPTEIIISESGLTEISGQRKVSTTQKRQRDSYLFQAAPNQIINIAVHSTEIDVMIELYDPEEFLIAACDNYPGWGTDALISVQLPDSSFMGQAPLPHLNTYRIVVSAIDDAGDLKSTHAGNAYIRQPATGEYEMKVTTSDKLLDITDRKAENYPYFNNYPNPFSQQTTITYELQSSTHVIMEIYDLKGQMILLLVDKIQPAGRHTVSWNGNDKFSRRMPDGIYICRMKAGNDIRSKKVMLYR